MKSWLRLCAVVATVASGGVQARELANWSFEEACGGFADDSISGLEAKLSPSMGWATGTFGKALSFTGKSSSVAIPEIPGWDGVDAFTVTARVYWRQGGKDRYPNILTSERWGGEPSFMFLVDEGKLRFRFGAKVDGKWKESGLLLLNPIPSGRWVHLAVTFAKPKIVAYVDGKKVCETQWGHELAGKGGFTLGGWNGETTHDGLIDDLAFHDEALTPAAIARLANDESYKEVEGYQDDGTGGIAKTRILDQSLPLVATVKGEGVSAGFDAGGRIATLKYAKDGRELIGCPVPFAEVVLADGRKLAVRNVRQNDGGGLSFAFAQKAGDAVVTARSGGGGIVFEVKSMTVKDAARFSFGRVIPVCQTYRGTFVNGCSDEKDAVVLRGFEVQTISGLDGQLGLLDVTAEKRFGFVGWRAGLVAAPRADVLPKLRAMTLEAGVPHTDAGGAWSLGSDGARRSYLFGTVIPRTTDCWIDLAERGGFSILHFTQDWAECLGHYAVRREFYPNGASDMKSCVDRIHAAGILSGIHTLTACISPKDSWITPICSTNLYADASYTLARPLGEDDEEIVVNELPIRGHDRVMTYMSNGNVLRIGTELVQYSDVRREKPYGFNGVKRGAFRTKVSSHAEGERCDYVHQRYNAFYPDPDSPLADELATRLSDVYNDCGHDEFYFDGSEGMGSRYGIDALRWKIAAKLQKKPGAPSLEASCRGANNWWFQSRTGTSDHPVWAAKRFHDDHIARALLVRKADFLEPQMGWWQPRQATMMARGHFLDDMEYFAAKNAGIDAAMSIQGVNACRVPFGILRQLTVLGWYERLRLARAFRPDVQAKLAKPGAEFRLRQDADGRWTVAPVDVMSCRSVSADTRMHSFVRSVPSSLAIRLEALYGTSSYDSGSQDILGGSGGQDVKADAAPGVNVKFSEGQDGSRGKVLQLEAKNSTAGRKASWARLQRNIPFPYLDLNGKGAFGLWVKGDGSGALMVLQVSTGREYNTAFSDHQIRLDFTGWRYFSFLARERDVDNFHDYSWPYGANDSYAIYRVALDMKHIGSVAVLLNDIPQGKSARVELSPVRALSMVPDVCVKHAQISVNGEDLGFPFAEMRGGDYAELEDGRWTLFDEKGEPLACAKANVQPKFAAGGNTCEIRADGGQSRLEATFFSIGDAEPATILPVSAAGNLPLSVEAEFPFVYCPAKGFPRDMTVRSRPGEAAQLTLTIQGPIANPCLTYSTLFGLSSTSVVFPVVLTEGERLVCRDGRRWQKLPRDSNALLAEGRLDDPLPIVEGAKTFRLSSADDSTANARFEIVKRYAR